MAGFSNDVMYANNVAFDGGKTATVTTNGQLLIGSTASPNIRVNTLTAGPGIDITNGAGSITIGLTGGGAAVETLTPNSGGAVTPVSDNINVVGLASNAGGNAFPTFSTNGGAGVFDIENRVYLSSYVVDTTTTAGKRGTFSTLASAITQAIADGATGAAGVVIYLRNVTIAETITVSTASVNITICGTGGKSNITLINGNPLFTGSFTNSGSGQIIFSNIDFSSAATVTNSSTGNIQINNCYNAATIVQSNASGAILLNNSELSANSVTLSGGTLAINSSKGDGGTITFSNSASLAMFLSQYSGTWAGTTSGAISTNNCYLPLTANTLAAGTLVDFNSTFGAFDYYANASVTYTMANTTAGNTYQATRSAISYVVVANADYYIGITNTASARTVTLPATGVIKNQAFIIKDESGGAATHNISVTVNGVKTIDGATTYAINTNYGSITVIYDGTNYFVI